ncbi:DUF421 domain-containing protein [Pullulanibacillus sp. KACC 23026]|uniref:DUF421 domain-containing protein n=1 Tax=Pullulanibacillus sp. KACC 23026 TaxID=3028315 RepID=UPI0023AF1830|nr:YetF domain-containing protein [Pullulanibacillus sp. KACC 23026]WEG11882.1 DUF421 domain-containing protein [Pullulanibacillus sp. KACC 23026]
MGIHWLFNVLTTCITFPFLLLLVRWIGKTQISQATYFNWVAGACMGNIGANIIASSDIKGIVNSAVQLFLFSGLTVLASYIALKSRKFRSATSGLPLVLINNGRIVFENLKKSKVNKDLLKQMLREQGHFNYEAIRWAILEPTGILSVLPMKEAESGETNALPDSVETVEKKKQKSQPMK